MTCGERTYRKRRKRYDVAGHAHYLTFSCFGRQPLFLEERSPRLFLEAMHQARIKHSFDLWAFVIMPEHVHVLLLPREGTAISAVLQAMKQPVARKTLAWAEKI